MGRAALLAFAVLCASVDQRWAQDRFSGRVAVVTGASSGIGRSIAIELVKRGMLVVGIARRLEPMQKLAESLEDQPGKLYPRRCDVRVEEQVVTTFQWIADNFGAVAVLVNSAGIAIDGDLINGIASNWRDILDTNVVGLSICTREAVQNMLQNGVSDGQIIHISSLAGFYVVNTLGAEMYTASKHAVTSLSESLRIELRKMKSTIRVTCIYPGTTNTPILKGPDGIDVDFLLDQPMVQPEDQAEAVIYALSTRPNVEVRHLMVASAGSEF